MIGERLFLFVKGLCIGFTDVIPGVSGGTLALILGLYTELVDTIKGLHLRWLPTAWRWLTKGRKPEDRAELVAAWAAMNLTFLVTLASGIGTAIVIGSAIIPHLMEAFPELMRGFFFGLILASVYVPARMIWDVGKARGLAIGLAFALLLGVPFGYKFTDPAQAYEVGIQWQPFQAEGGSLKELARRAPTSATLEQIYWAPQNAALRDAVAAKDPAKAADLRARHEGGAQFVADKQLIKTRQAPYEDLEIAAGTTVHMPQPALWFIFIAGAIAICAMILPGISGSYMLLIFGIYFFILNALKGLLTLPLQGHLPVTHATYVGTFVVALAVGILSFSRVLSFLLHRYPTQTLGLMVGLMLGCLRGIWPFRRSVEGIEINVLPAEAAAGTVIPALVACVVGVILVSALSIVGERYSKKQAEVV